VREGETIVTELEQLARLYPYDSVETLRVKSMVNYLTQDYSFDQIVRMEHAISLFIRGRIDREAFIKSLILPYERGGVEIPEIEARRMASVTERMMHHADDIRRFRARKDNANIFFNQHKLAERMRDHLLQVFKIHLSKEQDKNLVELIADRVTGVVEDDEMNEKMMTGVRSGGLGFAENEADEFSRYFEKVIAQGVDVSYKN
jgi:hypothetical protein